MAGTTTFTQRMRVGSPALVGSLCYAAAAAMAVGGLASAYLTVRHGAGTDFVPPAMKFNNYAAVLTLITMGIASIGAGWAVSVTRFNHRRWMFMGFALAAFMSLAAMNLVWVLGAGLGFGVNEHPYAVFVYALLAAALLALAIAAGTALLAAGRSLAGQVSAEQPHLGRAAAWVVHTATLVWLVVFAIIYLYK